MEIIYFRQLLGKGSKPVQFASDFELIVTSIPADLLYQI
jgi:hypothetical protein